MDVTELFSLKGKTALVTGAAYGIGFAIAEALASAGAKISFCCRSREHLDKALCDYSERGISAQGFLCDVTDEKQVGEMLEKIGGVDILVNNAGIIKRIPMTEMSADSFKEVVDIDLVAPFICSKAVIPGMIERGGGKIINVCSMMSELGRETVSAYASAKGGLKMLTKNIASEYGAYNIQCNGIGPGYIALGSLSPTAPATRSTALLSRRPPPEDGASLRIFTARRCFWPREPLISSTGRSFTSTAEYSPISADSPNRKQRPEIRYRKTDGRSQNTERQNDYEDSAYHRKQPGGKERRR